MFYILLPNPFPKMSIIYPLLPPELELTKIIFGTILISYLLNPFFVNYYVMYNFLGKPYIVSAIAL